MFKKFLWKLFPPRYVSLEQVERSHMFFENMRREISCDDCFHARHVAAAEKDFLDIIKRRKDYEEYMGLQEIS